MEPKSKLAKLLDDLERRVIFTIKQVHEIVVLPYEGKTPVRDEGTLEYIVQMFLKTALLDAANHKEHTSVDDATYLLYEIATKHPFMDGNKRTATIMALAFIYKESNDSIMPKFRNYQENKRYQNFIKRVAQKKHTKQYVKKFLTKEFTQS